MLQTKKIKRDSLFFNEFQYQMRIGIRFSSVLHSRYNWHKSNDEKDWNDLSEIYTSLVQFLPRLNGHKLVVGYETVYIYANDSQLLEELETAIGMVGRYNRTWVSYSEALVDRPVGTVRLKASNYKFRSYFRQTELTDTERTFLSNWLMNQGDQIRLSPNLGSWCQGNRDNRTYGNFFFDYNDPKLLSMLSLVRPGMIKITKDIMC
jgi:hypothetical protein